MSKWYLLLFGRRFGDTDLFVHDSAVVAVFSVDQVTGF
jgi:hypothetical protein